MLNNTSPFTTELSIKMYRPIFSIITICYNAEKEIERTLKSVQEQTYSGIEYIIIDGASTDTTTHIIKNYTNIVSTYVSEPDKGLYDAMNKGLSYATGDYICFLNAGDTFFECNTLTKIVHGLNGNTPDLIYGQTALVDKNQKFIRMRRLAAPEYLSWKSLKLGMLVCHQAFMPKRELAPEYNLKYKFSADYDWCIKILKQCKDIHYTRLILINYLNEGITTRNHKKSLKERYAIMESHYGKVTTFIMHLWFVLRHFLKK